MQQWVSVYKVFLYKNKTLIKIVKKKRYHWAHFKENHNSQHLQVFTNDNGIILF